MALFPSSRVICVSLLKEKKFLVFVPTNITGAISEHRRMWHKLLQSWSRRYLSNRVSRFGVGSIQHALRNLPYGHRFDGKRYVDRNLDSPLGHVVNAKVLRISI